MTGASGNAGREVVRALALRGITSRTPLSSGADRLDFYDSTTWAPWLTGVSAVFLMRPPPIADMDATLIPFIAAARAAGVTQIVFLSVAGADKARWVPHHKVEAALQSGPSGWTILRPGFFAQNMADAYLTDIQEDAQIYVPAGCGRVAFVDLRDVGKVAAEALLAPAPHDGQAYTLTGPRAVTFDEVAQMITQATGRSIRYTPASIIGYVRHLRKKKLRWGAVAVQTYLHVGLRFGQAEAVDDTLARILGHPACDIADYIADHKQLWSAAARD